MLDPVASLTFASLLTGLVLLAVRLVIAVAFYREATIKLKDIKAFVKNDGVPVPIAYVVAFCELAAALGMATGVLASWAGLGLVLLMIVTTSMHIFRWHSKYPASKGGWEYDLLLLVLASVVFVFGAGDITVMALLGLF